MPRQTPTDPSRSTATRPYRATRNALTIARHLTAIDNGRTMIVRPLADVLSPRTRAMLAAIRKTVRRG